MREVDLTLKVEVLIAVPPCVTTLMVPVVAPVGTVAVIWVAELTKKLALTPLNLTAVTPEKFVPVINTEAPTGPEFGVKLVIVGARKSTVKLVVLVTVPPAVVTEIFPVVAPVGTVAVIWVEELTVKLVAAIPFNLTAVAPVKFVPVMTTEVPTSPEAGVKLVIVGAGIVTVKLVELAVVPPGVVTEIVPVVAPVGTVAVI